MQDGVGRVSFPPHLIDPTLLPAIHDLSEIHEEPWKLPYAAGMRLEVWVFGLPAGTYPVGFRRSCARAGVPGLGHGAVKIFRPRQRGGWRARVLLHDPSMTLLVARLGIGPFSCALRAAFGWRCTVKARYPSPTGAADATTRPSPDPFYLACNSICVSNDRAAEFAPAPSPPPRALLRLPARLRPLLAAAGLRVGSVNVCGGLGSTDPFPNLKCSSLLQYAEDRNLHLVAVQEPTEKAGWRTVKGNALYDWLGDPSGGASHRGLGFLIHYTLQGSVSRITDVPCRFAMFIMVRGPPGFAPLIVGSVYLPTQGRRTTQADTDSAFAELELAVAVLRRRGRVVLLGDFNARVPRAADAHARVGQFGETQGNAAGQRMLRMLETLDMYSLNDRTPAPSPQWTRVRGPQRSVLDYAVVDADTVAHMWDAAPLSVTGIDIGSTDHLLLTLELPMWGADSLTQRGGWGRLHTRRPRRRLMRRWRTELLQGPQGQTVKEAYAGALAGEKAGFEALVHTLLTDSSLSADQQSEGILQGWDTMFRRVATAHVGQQVLVVGCSHSWWTPDVQVAVHQRRSDYQLLLSASLSNSPDLPALQARYLSSRREARRQVALAKKAAHVRLCDQVVAAQRSKNSRAAWRLLRYVRAGGRTSSKDIPTLRTGAGEIASSEQEVAAAFGAHYARLADPAARGGDFDEAWKTVVEQRVQAHLRDSALDEGHPGMSDPFSVDEVDAAMRGLHSGKAPGVDGIPAELLKGGGFPMASLLTVLFNAMLSLETVPAAWRKGVVVSIFKSGDKLDPGNYRGITLLSTVGKLFSTLLGNRMSEAVALHEAQAGFRTGRGCTDHIFSVAQTLMARAGGGSATYGFFLDIQKAFDVVWHDGLWDKLWEKGVRGRVWRLVRNMYSKARSCARVGETTSPEFDVLQGTAQGCPLSPFLFDVFIDGLMEEFEAAGLGIHLQGDDRLPCFTLADDFLTLSDRADKLQQAIDLAFSYCRRWRLSANVKKCAVVVFGSPSVIRSAPRTRWNWGGTPLPVEDGYKYLGIHLHSSCSWKAHFQATLTKAASSLAAAAPVLTSRSLSVPTKLAYYKSCILPLLEYGCEVWDLTATQSAQLEELQRKAARWILGCPKSTASAALLGELGLQPLAMRRLAAKTRWLHQLSSMDNSRYAKQVLTHLPHGWLSAVSQQWAALPSATEDPPHPPLQQVASHPDGARRCRDIIASSAATFHQSTVSSLRSLRFCDPTDFTLAGPQPYLRGSPSLGQRMQLKFRTGVACCNRRLHKLDPSIPEHCSFCGVGTCEDTPHLLLHCPKYSATRGTFFSSLTQALPQSVMSEFATLPEPHLIKAILSDGYWSKRKVLPVVQPLVKSFLGTLWQQRSHLLGSSDSG